MRIAAIAAVLGVGAMSAYVAPQMTADPRARFEHSLLRVALEKGVGDAARVPQVRREIGAKAFADLERVGALVERPVADPRGDDGQALVDATVAFNRDVTAKGCPVLLVPLGPRDVSSVFVARREHVEAAGVGIEAVWARPAPAGPSSMIAWSAGDRAAILRLDAIEGTVREKLIPTIALDKSLFRVSISQTARAFARLATEAVVQELLRESHLEARDVEAFVARGAGKGVVVDRFTNLLAEVEMQRLGFAFLEAQIVGRAEDSKIPVAFQSPDARLAAELALLAREQGLPSLALARVLEKYFAHLPEPESYLSGRAIPLVLAELGRDLDKDFTGNLSFLFEAKTADVRAAAARAYAKTFNQPLHPLTRTPNRPDACAP